MEEFDMKVTGIIAEYNPFHRGHAYHIEQAKKLTGADAVVVVMSGDFTQRGTPAIMDKYARARMALMNGADVVIELPSATPAPAQSTLQTVQLPFWTVSVSWIRFALVVNAAVLTCSVPLPRFL